MPKMSKTTKHIQNTQKHLKANSTKLCLLFRRKAMGAQLANNNIHEAQPPAPWDPRHQVVFDNTGKTVNKNQKTLRRNSKQLLAYLF